MKKREELMDSFIKENGEKIFELFYRLMRGNIDLKSSSEEEKIIAECIKNQCTDEKGEVVTDFIVH